MIDEVCSPTNYVASDIRSQRLIATGYSGNIDLLSRDNGQLVDYDLVEIQGKKVPSTLEETSEPTLRRAGVVVSAADL